MSREVSTIQMMKLYQDNVKQDISVQSDVLKLVAEKLNDYAISLASLKQVARELNVDYKNLEAKMNNLGYALRETTTTSRSSSRCISRASSMASFSTDSCTNSLSGYESDSATSEFDELDRTYVFVKTNADGTFTDVEPDDLKWKMKCASLSSSSCANESSSGASSECDEDNYDAQSLASNLKDRDNKQLNQSCNELIKMLLQNSQ